METIHCPLCDERKKKDLRKRGCAEYVRCLNCGLIYENPRLTLEELKEFYSKDSYFVTKDTTKTTSGYIDYFSQCSPALVNEYFQILNRAAPHGGTVRFLDLGCGPGNLVKVAQENGWEVVGVELSTWAAQMAQRQGLPVIEGTVHDARFPNDFFDVISLFDVLEHLPSPRKDVAEIHRILRPGGVVVAETPNIDGLFSKYLYRERSDVVKPRAHICLYSPRSVRRLFDSAGFRQIAVKTFPYCRRYTPGYFKRLVVSRLRANSPPVQFTFNESMRIVARK